MTGSPRPAVSQRGDDRVRHFPQLPPGRSGLAPRGIDRSALVVRDGAVFLALPCGRVTIFDEADLPLVEVSFWRANERVVGYPYARSTRRGGVYMHRILAGARARQFVDHVNGNTLDNRRCNLRLASRPQNSINAKKRGCAATSQFKGVYFEPRCVDRPWRMCMHRRKKSFATEIEAALAYDQAAKQAYGEFARLNFPNGYVSAPHENHDGAAVVREVREVVVNSRRSVVSEYR